FYRPPFCKKLSLLTIATAKTDESIQKNSGLSQGPVHPFGGRLTVRGRGPIALLRQGEFTMSEQAVEERRGGRSTSCGSRCTRSWSSWPCFCGYSSGLKSRRYPARGLGTPADAREGSTPCSI